MNTGTNRTRPPKAATPSRVPAWGFVAVGVLYATFYLPDIIGVESEVLWVIGILIHLALLMVTVVSLVLAFRLLEPDGWLVPVWIATICSAFLGLTLGLPFWSAAMIGLAVIGVTEIKAPTVSLLVSLGSVLWLFLFVNGVRIGDEHGRLMDSTESAIALVSLGLMSAGLIGMGWKFFAYRATGDSDG